MIYNVLMGMLNPTHSLTHLPICGYYKAVSIPADSILNRNTAEGLTMSVKAVNHRSQKRRITTNYTLDMNFTA